MRKFSIIFVLLLVACGGDENTSIQDTTSTLKMTLEEYNEGWIEDLETFPLLTKNEFDKAYKKILFDTHEERLFEFNKIKSYMMRYDYKDKWVTAVKKLLER